MNLTWIVIGLVLIAVGGLIAGLGWNWDKWHGNNEKVPLVSIKSEYQSGGITANKVTVQKAFVNVDTTRHIDIETRKQLLGDLKDIGETPITISITFGDSEAFQYAREIISILEEGGCDVKKIERVVLNPEYSGLNIKIANEGILKDAAILFGAIQKLDSDSKIIKDKRFCAGYLALIVGSRRRQ